MQILCYLKREFSVGIKTKLLAEFLNLKHYVICIFYTINYDLLGLERKCTRLLRESPRCGHCNFAQLTGFTVISKTYKNISNTPMYEELGCELALS